MFFGHLSTCPAAPLCLPQVYAGSFAWGHGHNDRGTWQQKFGKPFREDQTQLRIPQTKRDGGYFVAIVPVKQGEPAPQFSTVAGGKAIQVKFPDRTDTILLRKQAGDLDIGGQQVRGTAVFVTEQAGKRIVTDLAR